MIFKLLKETINGYVSRSSLLGNSAVQTTGGGVWILGRNLTAVFFKLVAGAGAAIFLAGSQTFLIVDAFLKCLFGFSIEFFVHYQVS